MDRKYDVIVIGSGIAGLTAAFDLKKAGKKVAIVESRKFGGVVANCGSTRKKKLVAYTELVTLSNQLTGKGITQPAIADWQTAMSFINASEDKESKEHEQALKNAGIAIIYGKAVFNDPYHIVVDGLSYEADNFVICTGAKPRVLDFPGAAYLANSAEFLTQAELPKKIVILGAGIIAFAFASIANAFGADVTMVQHDDRALAVFDQEMVQALIEKNKQQGIKFYFDQPVTKVSPLSDGVGYEIETATGTILTADKVYGVVGRVPNVAELGLAKIKVEDEVHGVDVNEYLQSSQPHIYACGDCADTPVPKLVPYAAFEAKYVAEHMTGQTFRKISYPLPAMSTFSQPKIAQVGVLTNEAHQQPALYEVETIDMTDWLAYSRYGDDTAILKIVVQKSDGKVVGVASLSNVADLLINYATFAINAGYDKKALKNLFFAYPSLVNDLDRFFK